MLIFDLLKRRINCFCWAAKDVAIPYAHCLSVYGTIVTKQLEAVNVSVLCHTVWCQIDKASGDDIFTRLVRTATYSDYINLMLESCAWVPVKPALPVRSLSLVCLHSIRIPHACTLQHLVAVTATGDTATTTARNGDWGTCNAIGHVTNVVGWSSHDVKPGLPQRAALK